MTDPNTRGDAGIQPASPRTQNERMDPIVTFTADGYLEADFGVTRERWREPVCPECGEPIRWVLDMSSWTSGFPTRLVHARCAWTKDGFLSEAEKAPDAAD